MKKETFPFSFKVTAVQVVDKDQTVLVEPDAASLEKIAKVYEVNGISALKAAFTLKPYRKSGLRVAGPITAIISQTCVASLEAFDSNLEIDVDRTFEPHSSRPRKIRDLNEEGEIEIDLESLDPPDVMIDGVLDLGAVICEELALALDLFPRKPGVEFEGGDPPDIEGDEGAKDSPSPFAALGVLTDTPKS
ncbi:MAG: DUF177 domain-containing protein [Roseibium sp.]